MQRRASPFEDEVGFAGMKGGGSGADHVICRGFSFRGRSGSLACKEEGQVLIALSAVASSFEDEVVRWLKGEVRC